MSNTTKTPDFNDVNEENVFEYELCRNFLGWQLSYAGGDLATFISKEEAEQIIKMMENQDIEDQAYEVD